MFPRIHHFPDPDELAGEAIGELQGAVEELNEILALLGFQAEKP